MHQQERRKRSVHGRTPSPSSTQPRSVARKHKLRILLVLPSYSPFSCDLAKRLASTYALTLAPINEQKEFELLANEIESDLVPIHDMLNWEPADVLHQKLDLLVNCVPDFSISIITHLFYICLLSKQCHFLDVCGSVDSLVLFKSFHTSAVECGCLCILSGGSFYGLSQLVAASLVTQEGAHAIRLDYSQPHRLSKNPTMAIYIRNALVSFWSWFADKRCSVDFGHREGRRTVHPIPAMEIESLQHTFSVPKLSAWAPTALLRNQTMSSFRIAVLGNDGVLRTHMQTHLSKEEEEFNISTTLEKLNVQTTASLIHHIRERLDNLHSGGVFFVEEFVSPECRDQVIQDSLVASHSNEVRFSVNVEDIAIGCTIWPDILLRGFASLPMFFFFMFIVHAHIGHIVLGMALVLGSVD